MYFDVKWATTVQSAALHTDASASENLSILILPDFSPFFYFDTLISVSYFW